MIDPPDQTRKYLRCGAPLSRVEAVSVKDMHINDGKIITQETRLSLVVVFYV